MRGEIGKTRRRRRAKRANVKSWRRRSIENIHSRNPHRAVVLQPLASSTARIKDGKRRDRLASHSNEKRSTLDLCKSNKHLMIIQLVHSQHDIWII
ncbi:hypothetical protein KPH14_005921 [Odynerus spinipes]|uniref:Uncharacterized protein n=1 Tax=Odynerus spinipes TaxID=1348599 RepID=A0AAD9RJM1_9HYME|nr:hypothetical protein KPH14_005921 [Odynerus spinipes]